MAHFAQLDDTNTVLQTIVVDNKDILDSEGKESETIGIEFCVNLLGGRWIQTSYNGNFRGIYAQPGYKYDQDADVFIDPNPLVFPDTIGEPTPE